MACNTVETEGNKPRVNFDRAVTATITGCGLSRGDYSIIYPTEEIRAPEKCSAQELINELVRRALENIQ
jgi:hypothetical protein